MNLTDAERARVAAARAQVLEHCPEAAALVKEFYDEGLIDGWRSVDFVPAGAPPPPQLYSLTGGQYLRLGELERERIALMRKVR